MENEKDTVLLETLKPGDKFEWSGSTFKVEPEALTELLWYEVRCCVYPTLEFVKLHSAFEVTKLEPKPTVVKLSELKSGDTFTWVGAEFFVSEWGYPTSEWVAVVATDDDKWLQRLRVETEVTVMR